MNSTADILRQHRGELSAKRNEADALVRKDGATGEDLVRAEKLYDECDRIGAQIQEIQGNEEKRIKMADRSAGFDRFNSEPAPGGLPFSAGNGSKGQAQAGFKVSGWEDAGHTRIDAATKRVIEEIGPGTYGQKTWDSLRGVDYAHAFWKYFRHGERGVDNAGFKILQEGLDPLGGFLVPVDQIMRIVQRQPAPTELLNYVTQLTTGRDMVSMPRVQYSTDDIWTTPFRVTWTGELPASDTAANVTDTSLFGEVQIPVKTAMMTAPLTNNMVEDSAFPIQAWLESKLSETDQLTREYMALSGNGASQPLGIYTAIGSTVEPAPTSVLSGASAALAYDGLVNLMAAIPPQYDGNCRFICNKGSTYAALLKLKDSQNRPILHQGFNDYGIAGPRVKTLMGDPIIFSQFAQDVGASNYPLIYGDFSGYYFVNRLGLTIQVLREVRARQNQIEVVARMRYGGKLVENWKIKVQKSNNS